MNPFERIRDQDEWLVFTWDGRRFAVPNARGHLIELSVNLRSADGAGLVAWHLLRERRIPIHCLNGELAPRAGTSSDHPLFVCFTGHPRPFGLLCDHADILRLREQGWHPHPIPPALQNPKSPLLGIAVGGGEVAAYTSTENALTPWQRSGMRVKKEPVGEQLSDGVPILLTDVAALESFLSEC